MKSSKKGIHAGDYGMDEKKDRNQSGEHEKPGNAKKEEYHLTT